MADEKDNLVHIVCHKRLTCLSHMTHDACAHRQVVFQFPEKITDFSTSITRYQIIVLTIHEKNLNMIISKVFLQKIDNIFQELVRIQRAGQTPAHLIERVDLS